MKTIMIILIFVCFVFVTAQALAEPMFRRIAIKHIYPDLIHGSDADYHVLNRQSDGSETVIWNNEETQPTEQEMQTAYDTSIANKEAIALKESTAKTDIKASVWYQKTDGQLNDYIEANWSDDNARKVMFKKIVKQVADMAREQGLDN